MIFTSHSYKGQGFVETLIATGVAGIASVVLMSVAIRTIRQTVKNEIEDEKTLLSSNMDASMNYLVGFYNDALVKEDDVLAPLIATPGSCFDVTVDWGTPEDSMIEPSCANTVEGGKLSRLGCDLGPSEDIFAVACVSTKSNARILFLDIVTGQVGCVADECKDHIRSVLYPID